MGSHLVRSRNFITLVLVAETLEAIIKKVVLAIRQPSN